MGGRWPSTCQCCGGEACTTGALAIWVNRIGEADNFFIEVNGVQLLNSSNDPIELLLAPNAGSNANGHLILPDLFSGLTQFEDVNWNALGTPTTAQSAWSDDTDEGRQLIFANNMPDIKSSSIYSVQLVNIGGSSEPTNDGVIGLYHVCQEGLTGVAQVNSEVGYETWSSDDISDAVVPTIISPESCFDCDEECATGELGLWFTSEGYDDDYIFPVSFGINIFDEALGWDTNQYLITLGPDFGSRTNAGGILMAPVGSSVAQGNVNWVGGATSEQQFWNQCIPEPSPVSGSPAQDCFDSDNDMIYVDNMPTLKAPTTYMIDLVPDFSGVPIGKVSVCRIVGTNVEVVDTITFGFTGADSEDGLNIKGLVTECP